MEQVVNEFPDENITLIVNGKEVEYQLLFRYVSKETNKIYLGVTDGVLNEQGKKNIIPFCFDPLESSNPKIVSEPTDIAIIEEILKNFTSGEVGGI